MLRVALVRTDVLENLSASFIRATRIGALGTKLVVTSDAGLRLALSKECKLVTPSPCLRTETVPLSVSLCFLIFRIPDDGQGPETQ
jgi:hypothetical protein